MKAIIALLSVHISVSETCARLIVNGNPGENVSIQCPLPKIHMTNTWPKYLSREKEEEEDGGSTLICSTGGAPWTSQGRFSIHDEPGKPFFTVTIRELTLEDSGMYFCGVEISPVPDFKTEVQLVVNTGGTKRPIGTTEMTPTTTISIKQGNSAKTLTRAFVLAMILVVTSVMCLIGCIFVLSCRFGVKQRLLSISVNQPERNQPDEISCYAEWSPVVVVETPTDLPSRRLSPVYQNLHPSPTRTTAPPPPPPPPPPREAIYQSLDHRATKSLSIYGCIQPRDED